MKMILGLIQVTSGEVEVFSKNIKGRKKRVYPRIGAIIETPGFYLNLTGIENLGIFATMSSEEFNKQYKNVQVSEIFMLCDYC